MPQKSIVRVEGSKMTWLIKNKMIWISHGAHLSLKVSEVMFANMYEQLEKAHGKIHFISDLTKTKSVALNCNRMFYLPILHKVLMHPNIGMHGVVNPPSYIRLLVGMLSMFGRSSQDISFHLSVAEAKNYILAVEKEFKKAKSDNLDSKKSRDRLTLF